MALWQLSLLFLVVLLNQANSAPLYTSGKWIVDAATGKRVKLHCANWPGHMPASIPEGLDKRSMDGIATRVAAAGFNCVRLTYSIQAWTNDTYYQSLTVTESLSAMNLTTALAGVQKHNPSILQLPVRDAYAEVVAALGKAGVMVVLDNHVSQPMWCCADNDGNGFFGDKYFDPNKWLEGLGRVAKRYKRMSNVIGMSLRNELRGPRANEADWYKYVTKGAEKIHSTNPNLLVIISGLNYDSNFTYLNNKPLLNHYNDKLVLEAHWYAFTDGKQKQWGSLSPNTVCPSEVQRFESTVGFVINGGNGSIPLPLFVSEWGVDQTGATHTDNLYLPCILAYLAEKDFDWALWTLQGSYYWRDIPEATETYGVLDTDWDKLKNPKFPEKFRLALEMLQDPGKPASTYQILYHPNSGLCLQVQDDNTLTLGDCKDRSQWNYEGNGSPVELRGSGLCMRAEGNGLPPKLSSECGDMQTEWKTVSSSGFQLAAKDAEGRDLCLESNSVSGTVLTNECFCLEDPVCSRNPQTQWFRVISSNTA